MNRIFYFNIDYICNNRCLFCFSSTTGQASGLITFDDFIERFNSIQVHPTDRVVINGGEPTLHPDFYNIISYVIRQLEIPCIVYSNAVELNVDLVPRSNFLSFVIPIHGTQNVHNYITQNKNAYQRTMANIRDLQDNKIEYVLKFIVSKEMIACSFNVFDFLIRENLHPKEIMLARLNDTKKSAAIGYYAPEKGDLSTFVEKQIADMHKHFAIKTLDIPPCYIGQIEEPSLTLTQSPPSFIFNDFTHIMVPKVYYKDVLIGSHCNKCIFLPCCKTMSSSYLTLSYRNRWLIEPE